MKDIILITVDCLRADYIYHLDDNKIHAPNLERIIEDSKIYPFAITNGPGTRFAFPAIMMSKLPGELEGIGIPEKGGQTISEFLSGHGYTTIGIHSNGWLSREYNYNRGFQYFFDPINWSKSEYTLNKRIKGWLKKWKWLFRVAKRGRDFISILDERFTFLYNFAEEVNEKLFELIDENKLHSKKKFIWLHYMDAHHPFYIHGSVRKFYPELSRMSQKKALALWRKAGKNITRMSDTGKSQLKALYKSEISYLDHYISQVVERFPEALIIITGDHGEEFGEHGRFHRPTFYNEMLNVPIIIYGSGKSGEDQSLISHVDLAPVIAKFLGKKPDTSWTSNGLINSKKYQFARYDDYNRNGVGIIDKKYKYIIENGGKYLFDRISDVVVKDEEKKVAYEKELNVVMDFISKRKIKLELVEVSEKTKKQLQNLGYY